MNDARKTEICKFSVLSEHHCYFRHNFDMLLYVAVYKVQTQHRVIYVNLYLSKFYITNLTKVWPLKHTPCRYDFIIITIFHLHLNGRGWRGLGSIKSQSNITLTSLCTTYKTYTYKAPKNCFLCLEMSQFMKFWHLSQRWAAVVQSSLRGLQSQKSIHHKFS